MRSALIITTMMPMLLGIFIIIAAIIIAIMFAKGVLIWRDVMLKQNRRWYEESKKMRNVVKF